MIIVLKTLVAEQRLKRRNFDAEFPQNVTQ